MLKIRHKAVECIGCAQCVEIAPDYWHLGADGMAQLVHQDGMWREFALGRGHETDRAELERAEESCPVKIIKIL